MANLDNIANEAEAILAQIVAAGEAREAVASNQGAQTLARAGEDIAALRKAAESQQNKPQDPETWGAILKAAERHPNIASQVAAMQQQAPHPEEPIEATLVPPGQQPPIQQAAAPPSQAGTQPPRPQSFGQRIGTAAQSFVGMLANPMSMMHNLPRFIESVAGLASGGGTAATGAASAAAAGSAAAGTAGAAGGAATGAAGAVSAAGGAAAAGAAAAAVAAPVTAAIAAAFAAKQAVMAGVTGMAPFMGKGEQQVATGMADSATTAALLGPIGASYELTQLPKHIAEWDEALLESKKGLANFSGTLNRYFAEAERRQILRDVQSAQTTGGAVSVLGGEWQKLLDEVRPLRDDITTHLAAILNVGTQILRAVVIVAKTTTPLMSVLASMYRAVLPKETGSTAFGTFTSNLDPHPGRIGSRRAPQRGRP